MALSGFSEVDVTFFTHDNLELEARHCMCMLFGALVEIWLWRVQVFCCEKLMNTYGKSVVNSAI